MKKMSERHKGKKFYIQRRHEDTVEDIVVARFRGMTPDYCLKFVVATTGEEIYIDVQWQEDDGQMYTGKAYKQNRTSWIVFDLLDGDYLV